MTKYVIRAPGMDPAEIDNFVFNVNLDVNFVHNRNMRIGNFAVASRTFKELVERHPGQAFAHFIFLARCDDCSRRCGSASYRRYEQIVAKSQVWREAAERFGLEIEHDDTVSGRLVVGHQVNVAKRASRCTEHDHSIGCRLWTRR